MTLRQRQLAVFAAISVLILVVGWFALIAPQRRDAATSAEKAQTAQSALDKLTGSGTSHGPTKQPVIHTSGLYALDTALPAQADQPTLLFEIGQVAKASGVKIISISPQTGQAAAGGYTVVPVNLSLDGTYYNITRFVHNLRMLVSEPNGHDVVAKGPLFSVTSISFAPGSDPADAPATVGLAAYYYGFTAGATPPVSTTDTTTTSTTGS